MDLGEFAPDHAHGVQKRELVGINVGFKGGLVHQTAHRKVRHHQAVELLTDQVRGFAAQDEFGTTQMGLEFRHRGFDLPTVVIEGGEFSRWRLLRWWRRRYVRGLTPIHFGHLHQELKRKGVTLQLLWEEYAAAHAGQAYRYSARSTLITSPLPVEH